MHDEGALARWRDLWRLAAEGEPFVTEFTGSVIQFVRRADGEAAVLKVTESDEERRGGAAMEWWAGRGVARVLARQDGALLLQRLEGEGELKAMAARGGEADDAATEILCDVASRLHLPVDAAADLTDLEGWFAELRRAATAPSAERALFGEALATAQALFDEQRPRVALHGDIHHANVMRSADGAWLAIDPKGLVGDAGYDFANILHNPSAEIAPGRLGRQARVIARRSGQPLARVLRWGFAYACLSAAWSRSDGREDWVALALTTARTAQAELSALA